MDNDDINYNYINNIKDNDDNYCNNYNDNK